MKRIKIIGGVVLAWFFIHAIIIVVDGLVDHVEKADCILILGNTVNPDGSVSERLKSRLQKGLQLYENQYARKIIVSGGLGKEGHYEGSVMKQYLVKMGVAESDLIVDDQGVSTNETAENFKVIASKNAFRSVIIVSQFFHISRTRMILKRKGVENVFSAHANFFEFRDLYSIPREVVGYYKYIFI